jgi:hypothetical protein
MTVITVPAAAATLPCRGQRRLTCGGRKTSPATRRRACAHRAARAGQGAAGFLRGPGLHSVAALAATHLPWRLATLALDSCGIGQVVASAAGVAW